MFYKEDRDFISEDQKNHLDDFILNNTTGDFPWFLSPHAVHGDKSPFFYHAVLRRPEARKDKELGYGPVPADASGEVFNSSVGPFFLDLLNQFTERNNIKYKMLYRCSVNITVPLLVTPMPHKDHEFSHKHFLSYLNDSDGDTCIFNEKETKIEKKIKPEKFKGVCFETRLHYGELPTSGLRAIVAYTFI